jgi:hypothetical protein
LQRPDTEQALLHLLGYRAEDLRSWLEKRFTDDMGWREFFAGRIHIDHVRPLHTFDLSQDEQVVAAWSLQNLQPLWARDNWQKAGQY